jgi:phage-related minor tail protein
MKARILGTIAFVAALMANGAFAQKNESKAGMPEGNMQMMAMHNQMMAEMKAMDANLDLKVAAMNAAKGGAKVDAMAAVINEMVSQHKQMMAKMMGMHEPMMKGMDGKSPDAHKEHHE